MRRSSDELSEVASMFTEKKALQSCSLFPCFWVVALLVAVALWAAALFVLTVDVGSPVDVALGCDVFSWRVPRGGPLRGVLTGRRHRI